MKKILTILLALASPALGQSVQQSGNVTPGHVTQWITDGVVGDGGTLGGGATLNGMFNAFDFLCANALSNTPLIISCGLSATGTNVWNGLQNFSGGATAPTRSPGDNTINLATTAFVQSSLNSSLSSLLGGTNVWTGAQTFTSANAINVNSYAGTAGTLFSNAHYGICVPNPPTACDGQGFFTSAGTTQNERYISNYFAQTAIYANTTRDATQGETGLYLTMATSTGYQPPGGATGQKAALQISGYAYPGGGAFWDAAMSAEWASGWSGASGNFGTVLELDPTNNDVAPVPIGGSTTTLIGLWLAGQIGTHPITSYLQMTPAGVNGAVFGAYYGIFMGGATTVQQESIHDGTSSFASYNDIGTHTTGINLGGTYSSFQIAGTGWGVSPDGKVTSTGYVATAAAPTVAAAQIGYGSTTVAPGSGTCPSGTVGSMSAQTVVGCIVVNIAGTARNVPFF